MPDPIHVVINLVLLGIGYVLGARAGMEAERSGDFDAKRREEGRD